MVSVKLAYESFGYLTMTQQHSMPELDAEKLSTVADTRIINPLWGQISIGTVGRFSISANRHEPWNKGKLVGQKAHSNSRTSGPSGPSG